MCVCSCVCSCVQVCSSVFNHHDHHDQNKRNEHNNLAFHPESARCACGACFAVESQQEAMLATCDGSSARRRERRLRSMLSHERQTVTMALSETSHQRCEGNVFRPTGTEDSQRTRWTRRASSGLIVKTSAGCGVTAFTASCNKKVTSRASWSRASYPSSIFLCPRSLNSGKRAKIRHFCGKN